jgi:hypothetical protein
MRTTSNRRNRSALRRAPIRLALVVAILTLAPAPAAAQVSGGPRRPLRPWTMGAYVGISRHSPVGIWGLTPDREHILVGLHATIPLLRGNRWLFAYAPEAIPLIVVSNNPTYVRTGAEGAGPPETVEDGRAPVAGAGIAPIGLEFQVEATRRLSVYTAGTMGGLWFTRHIPVVDARSFNFTFDFGGGVLVALGGRTRLRAGYKFHHLSNAKTAPSNPGVDAKMFVVGIERTVGS